MLTLSLELKQQITIVGGMTESIFRKAESLLLSGSDYWEALEFIARRKNMDKYRSVMDFLFCETFTEYRFRCFRYYNTTDEPQLRKIITKEQTVAYDELLVFILEICKSLWIDEKIAKLHKSWGTAYKEFWQTVAAA